MALMQGLSRRIRRRRRSEPTPDTPPPRASARQQAPRRLGAVADTSTTAMREALRFIKDSSDAFPPLKTVTGGLDAIVTMVETMNDNKADVIRLRSMVVSVSDTLEDLMIEEAFIPDKLRYRLAILDDGLQHIQKELDAMCLEGRFQRFIRSSKRRTYLAQLREDLIATDRAIQASSMTVVCVKLDRTDDKIDRLAASVSQIDHLVSANSRYHLSVPISIILFD